MASLSKAYAFSLAVLMVGGGEGAEKGETWAQKGEMSALAARGAVVRTCSETWWWYSQQLALGRAARSMCGVYRRGGENWLFLQP